MGTDERIQQLRAEIARLLADATEETRTTAFRDWSTRRIPHAFRCKQHRTVGRFVSLDDSTGRGQ
jgi:hypothetical protein